MRLLVFTLCLLLSLHSLGADGLLVPVFTPKPDYPPSLIDSRYTGKVRVSLTVAAHGGIQATKVVESGHPLLTEAVQQAAVKWRFKPWDTANGEPSSVEITVPILFGARGIEPFSREITMGLAQMLCAYLNYEIKTSLRNLADQPMNQVDVFWYTQHFLSSSYVTRQVPEQSDREALSLQLQNAIPRVIKHCKKNPDHPVAYYLPKGIRDLLVGL